MAPALVGIAMGAIAIANAIASASAIAGATSWVVVRRKFPVTCEFINALDF